jgi:hypothetical protein
MFWSDPFWVNFCTWCKEGTLLFFCMWISSFSSMIFWKDYPFPTEWFWHDIWKLFDNICEGLFLGSLFYSIALYLYIYLSLCQYTSFHHYSFIVSFEVRKCRTSNFVFLF